MSCCPPAPKISQGDSGDSNYYLQESEIIPGESVDCFAKRAGDSTGRMDDKTENPPDKIANTDIPLTATAGVNVTFKLTAESTRVPTSWTIDQTFTGVTFTPAGVFSGTFGDAYLNKSVTIKVTAKDATGDIDSRSYTFSPAKSTPMESIQFLHPLPGARVTSVFGPRKPPKVGASSIHGGVDFAYTGGRTGDVCCAADGEVVFTGFQAGGAGNYVKVKHVNGSGKHMCTTVYMHLASILVKGPSNGSPGQKVVAGQKIGVEGNTGIGTGAHLHFECRMPNDSKVDPMPYIKGSIDVAAKTNPDNTAVESSVTTQTPNGVMTPANVDAKQGNCEPYGPTYPKDPAVPTTPLPTLSTTDPFEKAWFFTMKHEVGPHWTEAYPSDPDVAAGKIDTTEQRKKCGYVMKESFPGGETKFGIAQGPNPGVNVRSITYASAKQMGYNNYWSRGPSALASAGQTKTAIVLFDINYLHGVGNGNKIKARAGSLAGMNDGEAADKLSAAQRAFMEEITAANPSRNGAYIKGWLKRSAEINSYAKSA